MHARRPALLFAIPLALGVWLGGTFGGSLAPSRDAEWPARAFVTGALLVLPVVPLIARHRAAAVLVTLGLGALRGVDGAPAPLTDVSPFASDSVWVGRVAVVRNRSFVLDDVWAEPVAPDGAAPLPMLTGRLDVVGADTLPELGERIRVHGRIAPLPSGRNPGLWDPRRLARRDRLVARLECEGRSESLAPPSLGWRVERALGECRRGIIAKHEALYDSTAASFHQALFLGDRSRLDPDLGFDFRDTGAAHLLALSGEHVSLVALFVDRALAFARIGAALRWPSSLLLIGAYVFVTGAPASVARAGILFALCLGARPLGRRLDAANALGVSLTILLLLRPEDLWDAGLLLSFGATGGIIFLYPVLRAIILPGASGLARAALDLILVTLSATLPLLPLEAHLFGALPVCGLVTNPILVPLTGLLLALHVTTLTASLVPWSVLHLPALDRDLAAITMLVTRLDVALVRALAAALPPPALVPAAWIPCAALYAGALALLLWPGRARASRFVVAMPLAALIAAGLPADAALRITLLDVGQGDAILVESRGARVLVDAGPRSPRSDAGERIVAPALRARGVRRLDALLLSHGDADHCGGAAAVLRRIDVGVMIEPDPLAAPRSRIHGEARAIATLRGVAIDSLRSGDRLVLGPGVSARVLHPRQGSQAAGSEANGNERSIALEIEAVRFRFLTSGDLGATAESRLPDLGLAPGTVLKVAHHGSRGSTPECLLAALAPPVALISAGERNRYGHPHPDVLSRLSRSGALVMRTDERGALSLETDGVRAIVRGHIGGRSHSLIYDAGGAPRRAGALARTPSSAPPPRMH